MGEGKENAHELTTYYALSIILGAFKVALSANNLWLQ